MGSFEPLIREPSPPFSIRVLERNEYPNSAELRNAPGYLSSLLPAIYRDRHDNIWSPAEDVAACIDKELNLTRLAHIHAWLKIAGRPMMPRPLHDQHFRGRDITSPRGWTCTWCGRRDEYSSSPSRVGFWSHSSRKHTSMVEARRKLGTAKRAASVAGELSASSSHTPPLIAYESDFHIARDKRLIPTGVNWPAWRTFVEELLGLLSDEPVQIDARFRYGELRLSRLNKIHYLWVTPLRGYVSRWNQCGSLFSDNFIWMASATVLLAVVLTAMQVGLATRALENNEAFQAASYGFTVFTLVGLASAAGIVLLQFCYFSIDNLFATVRYAKKRFRGRDRGGGV